jgi:signal transduction histidine kinase/CheY-like chemotaxis protein
MHDASFSQPAIPPADRGDPAIRMTALRSLDTQAALLPYALVFFGVALPIFAWVCTFAADRVWMTASFAIFAINWAMFYATIDWLKRHPEQQSNVNLRSRIHILGGLIWAAALAQITAVALGAGPARETLLLLAVGGAAACIFFSSPNLAALLIVTPAAAAAPLLALHIDPATQATGRLALGGIALVMALSLILNRLLRRMFTLANEHEDLVEERARSLDDAERLAKTKSDLVATLSQEIRTGLTGLAHTLGAAGAGGRSAPTREQLNAALTSAQDLIAVLNATLDTVSAESGSLDLEHRAFDIAALAREAVLEARPLAAAKGLELGVHVDSSLSDGGGVVADEARTRQILANLIGNAIKYTVRGRIEVRLEPPAAGRIRLEVADTGPGLSPEELDLAFQPFQRIARTGAGVSGAGLGLSLSRRLAVLMKGEVSAESAVGVGSCFRLDLTFDPTVRLAPPTPAPEAQPAPGRASRSLRVLIAEDDPLNAAMLRAALEQLGHHVLHAQDGRRAVDLAQVCDIDLIMLDGHMPEIEGPGVARAIRALAGASASAPMVAVIGGDADEARAFADVGVDQALRKPVTVASVARAIAQALHEEPPRLKAVS